MRQTHTHDGLEPACLRRKNGRLRHRSCRLKATSSKANFSTSLLSLRLGPRGNPSRCLVMFGSGHGAATPLTRDILQWPAPWGNTTANSCATSMFCAAAPAPRLSHISDVPTETFSHLTPDGNSRE